MDATTTYPTPTIGKMHIDAATPTGTDPLALAMLSGNRGGMFGNGENGGLLMLLLLAMFRGNGGFLGNGGGDAAAQALSTSKDVMAQLNTFQSWAANNATQIQQAICGIDKSLCSSTGQIVQAVNALTPQMYQAFANQTAVLTTMNQNIGDRLNNINSDLTTTTQLLSKQISEVSAASAMATANGFAAGALAECQTQNLVNTTASQTQFNTAQGFTNLSQRLSDCCCENRLAIANQNALIERNTAALSNQMSMQTCEIKQAISADGQATRALIQANQLDEVRQQLADAKAQVSNLSQTAAIIAAIGNGKGNGNGNDK